MGVWIETSELSIIALRRASHPVWVCGLKQTYGQQHFEPYYVTPCMGVWIETITSVMIHLPISVTPCMGVWIETYYHFDSMKFTKSHPVWVCGLKLDSTYFAEQPSGHTLYGCVD